MVFLHLFVVNKSGGLIHHRPLVSAGASSNDNKQAMPRPPKLGTNEWLRIGSTFHSLHAIAAEASPVRFPSGKNSSKLCVFLKEGYLHCTGGGQERERNETRRKMDR